jgi:lipopolysaccharide transport system permease protein
MFIFTIFFGQLAKIPSGDLPYSLFVLIGLVFWGFFSGVLSHASNSLVENDQIIKKVYFPKLILPLSSIVTNLIDFSISFTLLLVISFFLQYVPNITIVLVVILGLLIGSLGAGGLGLFLAAFNVKYRDVRYILPFFIQMMIFLTPVIYPVTIIRPSFRILMALNPMTGIIDAARTSFAGSSSIDFVMLGVSFASAVLLFFFGLLYFRSTERSFADIA